LLSIPIASYYSIERLALIYFSYAQQDHKLNEIGIISHSARIKRLRGKALIEVNGCSGEYALAFSNNLHPCSVLIKINNAVKKTNKLLQK
jgi:hypothetical protein